MEKNAKIYVAGKYGMVGAALIRELSRWGYNNIMGHSSKELDLMNQQKVREFFEKERPDYVFLAAAKVGGIYANATYPAEFIYNNLQIQTNIFDCAYTYHVKKLLFLGSVCIYPKYVGVDREIVESDLLSGELEPTNQYYAIAKIAGIKMCEAYNKQYRTNFVSCMPANLYGPGDNYAAMTSHVIPALLRRFHEAKLSNAKEVVVWGTGKAKREFLYVDDLAKACIFIMNNYLGSDTLNIGSGTEVTIKQLVSLVAKTVGYKGKIVWDKSKPDGTPKRLLDSSRVRALGWKPTWPLREGLGFAYQDFRGGKVRM